MLLTKEYKTYLKVSFSNEEEIENVILDNVQLLFGDYICLLPKARLITVGGKGTIPDGVLINFQSMEWFIIEVERGIHGTWDHIAPQISKQLTAIANETAKAKIITQALGEIQENKELKDLLAEIGIEEIHVHGKLQSILSKPPIIALPIDIIPDDLEEWADTLRNEIRIWTVEKYINDNNDVIYSIPDIESEDDLSQEGNNQEKGSGPKKTADLLKKLIAKGLLQVDQQVYFDYGPKGKSKTHFEGKIKLDGIEIDEKVYSPSIAALKCIQTISKYRKSANGWKVWKTLDGALLNETYKKFREEDNKPDAF
jgi:hypothetical protein